MQSVEIGEAGELRFRENKIVNYLLEKSGITLSDLARLDFPKEDRDQFMQLHGYSVRNAPISFELKNKAFDLHESGSETDRAKVEYLEKRITDIKEAFKHPVADLFNIHPSDLE